MMAKIEWYREVLALEPGSKVFFPLARLYLDDGQVEEAILTLRQGIERHPEFVEARLLLIELLHQQQGQRSWAAELAGMDHLFTAYPGFWDAWGQACRNSGGSKDFSLTLSLISAMLKHKELSLVDVLRAGLERLELSEPAFVQSERGLAPILTHPAPVSAKPALEAPAYSPPSGTEQKKDLGAVPNTFLIPLRNQEETLVDTPEKCSLRTHSMAQVLAEQGDISGALDIYNELLAFSKGQQKEEILKQIRLLQELPESPSAKFATEALDMPEVSDTAGIPESKVSEIESEIAFLEEDAQLAEEAESGEIAEPAGIFEPSAPQEIPPEAAESFMLDQQLHAEIFHEDINKDAQEINLDSEQNINQEFPQETINAESAPSLIVSANHEANNDRAELQATISDIENRVKIAPPKQSQPKAKAKKKNRTLELLEGLAQRLESRT